MCSARILLQARFIITTLSIRIRTATTKPSSSRRSTLLHEISGIYNTPLICLLHEISGICNTPQFDILRIRLFLNNSSCRTVIALVRPSDTLSFNDTCSISSNFLAMLSHNIKITVYMLTLLESFTFVRGP